LKTGDAISPPGGFVGGNMDELVDVAIDPAGNVWVTNNWRDSGGVACFEKRPEATSTRCGGYGVTEFYGMAKPVSADDPGCVKTQTRSIATEKTFVQIVDSCANIP
jgi:hypothetical protein